nr:BEACH domain-containing protein B isoform X1 [Ipomoea batatas]GMC54379.1 BEACH domain-containing protein B isoform X1 [Ipomoea batatas]GMC55111.1 BEACH domain-containing protein B isoform X1 [Ipomoea batatas]GME12557.1 BEACH domain-containing protein B isoform X1 [Ipomoea batatas]
MFDLSKPDQVGGSQKQNIFKWPISLDLDSERGRAIDSISALCGNAPQKNPNNIKRHRRWIISKVKAVHWTRYLLRYTAIEIFFNDSTAPVFLNFATQKDAKDVGSLIVTTRNESVFPKGYRDKTSIVSFVDRRVALEMAAHCQSSLLLAMAGLFFILTMILVCTCTPLTGNTSPLPIPMAVSTVLNSVAAASSWFAQAIKVRLL